MTNNRLTVTKILNKLVVDLNLRQVGVGGTIFCPYSKFKSIMMLDEGMEPVISYERTVKEKYVLLQDFNFISRQAVVNVGAIFSQLGIEA